MGVRARSYGAELCVQALSANWPSGEERGCSLRIRRWRSVKIYRETVLQKRKKPHSWGSNSAVAFERGFVLAVRPVSCARAGHLSAMESTRPRRASGSDGIHAPAPSLWSRWNPHARAGFPTVLAEALARLRVDVRRRIRRCAGTSEHARFWGVRRSARGCLAPRFRLHRRTERDRQRRGRTAFRG